MVAGVSVGAATGAFVGDGTGSVVAGVSVGMGSSTAKGAIVVGGGDGGCVSSCNRRDSLNRASVPRTNNINTKRRSAFLLEGQIFRMLVEDLVV